MLTFCLFPLISYDSSLEVDANNIATEQGRIQFVQNVAQLMATKAHLNVNIKRLYMADVSSVRELDKFAQLIQQAWDKLNREGSESATTTDHNHEDGDEDGQSLTRKVDGSASDQSMFTLDKSMVRRRLKRGKLTSFLPF